MLVFCLEANVHLQSLLETSDLEHKFASKGFLIVNKEAVYFVSMN